MDELLKQHIPTIVTLILLLWSEYLGVSKQHKSNAITQLLICALTPKPHEEEPQSTIVTQPDSQPQPSL
jgi:hypothetical protein